MTFLEYDEFNLSFNQYKMFTYFYDDDDTGISYARFYVLEEYKRSYVIDTVVYANSGVDDAIADILCNSKNINHFDKDNIIRFVENFFDFYKLLLEVGDEK